MCRMNEQEVVRPCRLHLEIVSGDSFQRKNNKEPCNTSCLVRCCGKSETEIIEHRKGQLFRTLVKGATSTPVWNESFVFDLASVERGQVEISVWDTILSVSKPAQTTWIGQIVLNTAPLAKSAGVERQLKLMVRQNGTCNTYQQPSLSLRVKVELGTSRPKQVELGASRLKQLKAADSDSFRLLSSEMKAFFESAQEMTIFQNIDRNAVLALCKRMKAVHYPSNALVFAEGTEGRTMYFVVSGECVVVIGGKAVVSLTTGDHFGEIALLVSQKRTADIYTTTECHLLEITQEDLHEVLDHHSECATALFDRLKKISELRVKRFSEGVEQHPSAINGDNALNASQRDRQQRIKAWHRAYPGTDMARPSGSCMSTDEAMEDDGEDEAKLFAEAKRLSGVDDKVVAVVKDMKLFRDSPARALAHVVSKLKVQGFDAGETIIEEGAQGSSMYIIDYGSAEVLVKGHKVAEMLAHTFFGEVALVTSQTRTATVVAKEPCKCLRLEQNDLWTVFNMFPSMYKTLAEVADARVHNASSSDEVAVVKSPQRRASTSTRWNVKFRAPLKHLTPEQAGVRPRSCIYVSVDKMQAVFAGEGNDKSHVTVAHDKKVLYRGKDQPGTKPVWEGVVQQHLVECDGASRMHFTLHRSSGSFRRREHPIVSGSLPLLEIARAHRDRYAVELAEQGRKAGDKGGAEGRAQLRVSVECSPAFLQPYALSVPMHSPRPPSFASIDRLSRESSEDAVSPSHSVSHGSATVLPILDRAGNTIMWARWRGVPEEDSGVEQGAVLNNKYVTVIDLATADGTYGGSVVTDVTESSHARSRLMTNLDVHWATVKTKMHRQKKKKQQSSPVRSPQRSPQAVRDVHFTSRFKVVPIYNEFEISTASTQTSEQGTTREVVLSRYRKDSQRMIMGIVKVATGHHSHVRVDAMPNQDIILLTQLALALGESQVQAPPPAAQPVSDAFDKGYHTS